MIDPNVSISLVPAGTDLLNATGLEILSYSVDGTYYNYHIQMIEYSLLAILALLAVWFSIWLYFRYTRTVSAS